MLNKIQTKIILIVLFLALAFSVLLFLVRESEKSRLRLVMSEQKTSKEKLVLNIIRLVGTNLENWAFNDTYWDEMVNSVTRKDLFWADQIIATALKTYNSQSAWMYNTDFEMVYNTNTLGEKNFQIPMGKDTLKKLLSEKSFSHFFLDTKFGLIEFRTAPIQPSYDILRKTPPQGYFIVSRLWSRSILQNLENLTNSKVLLLPTDDYSHENQQENHIIINHQIKDWQQKSIYNLSFISESAIYTEYLKNNTRYTIWVIIFASVIILTLSLFLQKYVNYPLKSMSLSLKKGSPDYLKELKKKRTEFSNLVLLIEEFFKQKAELSNEIAERKSIEEKLKKYTEELKAINAGKDKLFSIIAHDLKSPFLGLLGFSDILIDEYDKLPDEKIKKYIAGIRNNTKSLYELIDNLLTWSRIQTGRMEFKPININLLKETKSVIELLERNASVKQISIKFSIEPDLNAYADSYMIRSVIQNTLSNAIKFTNVNGEINISAAKESKKIIVKVSDNGIGLSPENLKKIFRTDIYYTTNGTNNEKGTGLGLLICKEMVEKNSGEIFIESKEGIGTTVTFSVPVQI